MPYFQVRHCFVKSRRGCWYSLLSSDGIVFTNWFWLEFDGTSEWLFSEGYILVLDLRPFILFEVSCAKGFLFVL